MKPVCSMDLCDQFSVLLVCLYIDDLLVTGSSEKEIQGFK